MTEKRFIVEDNVDQFIIYDNNGVDDYYHLGTDERDVKGICDLLNSLNKLEEENEQLRQRIQIYEQLISNSYVGEEETLDGFVGKYVIWEDELQKYRKKIKKVMNDEL